MIHKKSTGSVAGIVFNNTKDKILLIKRRDVPVWTLPGGGIEPNESPAQAVIREIQEETGIDTLITRQVAFYTPLNILATDTYTFECSVLSGTPTPSDETTDVAFFSLNQMPTPFFFVHYDWLQDALKNQPSLIQKPLSQVTYLNLLKYFCKHPIHVIRAILSRIGLPINR